MGLHRRHDSSQPIEPSARLAVQLASVDARPVELRGLRHRQAVSEGFRGGLAQFDLEADNLGSWDHIGVTDLVCERFEGASTAKALEALELWNSSQGKIWRTIVQVH